MRGRRPHSGAGRYTTTIRPTEYREKTRDDENRPDHATPHVCDRAAIKTKTFLRLPEVAAYDVRELIHIDDRIGIRIADILDRINF